MGYAERALLCRLGLFQGGVSLHIAQTVCTSAWFDDRVLLDTSDARLDRSLVQVYAASLSRVELLETTP